MSTESTPIQTFPELIPIGYVQKTIGFNGQIQVQLDTDVLDLSKYPEFLWFLQYGKPVPFLVTGFNMDAKDKLKLSLEDIASEQDAIQLKNLTCMVEASCYDDYFASVESYDYLLGYEVLDQHHGKLGIVEDVLENDHGHDNLKVIQNKQEILIPFVDAIVFEINEERKNILVSLPEGLLDLYLK